MRGAVSHGLTFKKIRGIVTIWLIMPLDHKDMPQVGYYHLEIIQKYLKFFKNDVFLKFFLRFSVSSGSQPPPPLSPKGKRKELEVFPYGP